MTIEEAIEQQKRLEEECRIRAKQYDECYKRNCTEWANEHKQLAEWLEELKVINECDLDAPQHFTKEQTNWVKKYCITRNKEFYNKAINDLSTKLKEDFVNTDSLNDSDVFFDFVDRNAERLKVGGNYA